MQELEDLLNDGGAMSGDEGGGRKRRVRAPAARKTDAEKQVGKNATALRNEWPPLIDACAWCPPRMINVAVLWCSVRVRSSCV